MGHRLLKIKRKMKKMKKGIDVSKWQGEIDFKKVKADGIDFVIINAGYGRFISQKDKCFEENYKNAKANGLEVGAYWYSYAVNSAQAKAEAETFLEAIKGKSFEYPLAFDIEDKTQVSLSKDVISEIIDTFCGYVEKQGYYISLYSYASFLNTKVLEETKKKYDVWLAEFDVSKPSYSGAYGIWQYSSSGKISGISGKVDLNYAYKDYPTLIAQKGLNGLKKPQNVEKTVLDKHGYELGDKTIGVFSMKQLLIIAQKKGIIKSKVGNNRGYGGGTQNAVNEFLGNWGYIQNGIAGTNFIRKLGEILL